VTGASVPSTWHPSLGAWPEGGGIRFRVWAPARRQVMLVLEGSGEEHALEKGSDGTFGALVETARPGDRYRYRLDGDGLFPDPVSRFQPEGVHGPSEVIDPGVFAWSDAAMYSFLTPFCPDARRIAREREKKKPRD
jgi:maltooligosyltrehalose trehalohydrolase